MESILLVEDHYDGNFMCQLDWATGCPDIWLNIIRDMFLKVFLDEINI